MAASRAAETTEQGQIGLPQPAYIIVRLLLAIYFDSLIVYGILWPPSEIDPHVSKYFYLYFTSWGYIILCIHLTLAAIIVSYMSWVYKGTEERFSVSLSSPVLSARLPSISSELSLTLQLPETTIKLRAGFNTKSYNLNDSSISTPWYVKPSWMFYTIHVVSSIIITIVYFIAIFRFHLINESRLWNGLIDAILLVRYPIRILHMIYLLLVAVLICSGDCLEIKFRIEIMVL
ncbi:unnamed protein product [Didymodactylos carnosus]|uniref:Uncharacterized protein n=1 Tax=Didymodactylos carnosus TaxID=1234261 RepID=A0A813PJD0_9BILA|nr:unnamed protein product [Didymodactylos carnosus]CAF3533777.1 unnamed protein product [Didymodactylos carnosus]